MRGRTIAVLVIGSFLAGAASADPLPTKTLAECTDIALANHPSLKASAAIVDAGRERIWEAGSSYLPQVLASYSANRRNTSAAARTGTNIGTQAQTFNFYNAGVSFTQILFDFGQGLDSIRAAQELMKSLRANDITQRESVVLNVKQAYFNLLAARRLLAVADETVRQDQKHLEDAQGRFHVGLAAKFDVTRAQVQLANAELNQVTARNNVAVSQQTLRNALGLTRPLDFDIVDTLAVPPIAITEEAALNTAYDRRPELESLHAQQLATVEQIAALRKSYLPNITGNGSYNWSGTDTPLQSNWTVGANVNLSVFNGGLTTAQIGEARANLENLKANEEGTRQNIALEVRQAVLNLQQAGESIRVSEKALEQARENLELAEGRYKTGVGNIIELTDAQASLTSAEASHVQALYSNRTALAALEKATAGPLAEISR